MPTDQEVDDLVKDMRMAMTLGSDSAIAEGERIEEVVRAWAKLAGPERCGLPWKCRACPASHICKLAAKHAGECGPAEPAVQLAAAIGEAADKVADERDLSIAQVLADRETLRLEVGRLHSCLKRANGNHEEFERKWYLESDAHEETKLALARAIDRGREMSELVERRLSGALAQRDEARLGRDDFERKWLTECAALDKANSQIRGISETADTAIKELREVSAQLEVAKAEIDRLSNLQRSFNSDWAGLRAEADAAKAERDKLAAQLRAVPALANGDRDVLAQAAKKRVDAVVSAAEAATRRPHIVDGEFQSDKYPTTPRGKVPLSVKDPTAQDLLWEYAQRRRVVDAAFADDLEWALREKGFAPPPARPPARPR